jgi:hypothetical protein
VQIDGAAKSIAVARNNDGTLVLYLTDALGNTYRREQVGAGTNNFVSPSLFDPPPGVGDMRSIAAERNGSNLIELFAVASDGKIWHRRQQNVDSISYTGWSPFDGTLRP